MSATDELRSMLDERGVEWDSEDMRTNMQTYWGDWCFMEPLDAKPHTLGAQCELMLIPATPEQAIAATLGGGGEKSRYSELFGTPERAARTLAKACGECDEGFPCWECPLNPIIGSNAYEPELLEWLRGDVE